MKNLLPLVFVILMSGILMMMVPSNSYGLTESLQTTDYNEQKAWQQEHLWQLGKNLSVGDSYTYNICDPGAIQNYSAESYHYFTKNLEHNSSLCYTIKLDFVNFVSTDENQISGNVWIVQAAISDNEPLSEGIRYSVFHVDADSFNVRSADTIHPDTIRYADSIQNTLFSIHKYTASESKLLRLGNNCLEPFNFISGETSMSCSPSSVCMSTTSSISETKTFPP